MFDHTLHTKDKDPKTFTIQKSIENKRVFDHSTLHADSQDQESITFAVEEAIEDEMVIIPTLNIPALGPKSAPGAAEEV